MTARRLPATQAIQALSTAQWVSQAARRLARAKLHFGHGAPDAYGEAAWIAAHARGVVPEALAALAARRLPAAARREADRIVAERIRSQKPLAYLLGEAWLMGKRFIVDERVIVPRSFIAEWLPEHFAPWIARPETVRSVLDLCTGSGCLAVLAAQAFPRAQVEAIDLSPEALQIARANLRLHRLSRRISLVESDLFAALEKPRRRYDLLLCNPPYVNGTSMRRLPAEYRHEPALALAGGRDGLDLVRKILHQAARHLAPRGLLVMEIGHNRRALERAFPRTPFTWLETSAGPDMVFLLPAAELPRHA